MLRIYLFGPFRVELDSQVVSPRAWARPKDRALLKVLALEQGHLISRDRLIDLLWPDLSPEAATNSLHVAVSRLRRLLAMDLSSESGDAGLIRRDQAGYSLVGDSAVWVDLHEFRRLADRGREARRRGEPLAAIADFRAALDQCRGALFEDDPGEPWAIGPRETARELRQAIHEQLAECLIDDGAFSEAVEVCERGLADDPVREALYALLLRAHESAGHPAEGLRAFERCREALRERLGVDPGPAVRAVHERLLRGDQPPGPARARASEEKRPSGATGQSAPRTGPSARRSPSLTGPDRRTLVAGKAGGPLNSHPPHLLACVGRESELGYLLAQLDRAGRREGRLVLVRGEPGIGKSRLLDELGRLAAERGARVLTARAYEMERDLPYAPLVETFSAFFRVGADPDEVAMALGPGASGLAGLIPSLHELLPGLPRHQALRPDAERAALIAGLTHLVLSLGRTIPLLLLLDDLQWADASTLQWLHYLARRLTGERVLVVGAFRTGEVAWDHPLERLRGSLAGDPAAPGLLDLGCLTVDQVAALFPDVPGSAARGRAIAARLHRETDGHPLFLIETLRTLQETGVLKLEVETGWVEQKNSTLSFDPGASEDRLPVASSLAEAIRWRTRRLNEAERRLLAIAAVCDRGFSPELLATVAELAADAVLDVLDVLAARQLVRPAPAGRGYDFRHDLIREVVYRDLGADRRRILHGRVAEALAGFVKESPRLLREAAGELAYHYRQAEGRAKAFEYSMLAGDHARDAFAPREALVHYLRAAEDADHLPSSLGPYERARLVERLGRSAADAGDLAEAARYFEELSGLARTLDDAGLEGRALVALADVHFFRHDFARAEEKVAAALALSRTFDDSGLRVGAEATASSIAMAQGRTDEAERRCDAVLELTGWQPSSSVEENSAVAGARLNTLGWVGLLRTMQGDHVRAQPAIEASLRLGQELHNPFLTGRSRFALAMSLGNQGRYDEALATLREALRLAEEAGDRYFLPRLLNTVGWVYADLGDLPRAEDWNRRSIAVARETGWLEAEANARVNLATDALHQRDRAVARQELEHAAALVDRDGWFTWRYRIRLLVGLGELSLLEGNPEQALAFAGDALARAQATTSRKHLGRAWLLNSRALLLAGGPPEEALRQMEQAHALAVATGNPPLLWASGVELAGLRARLGQEASAATLQQELRASVDAVLGNLQDPALRASLSATPLVQRVIADNSPVSRR